MTEKQKILIIDDEPDIGEFIRDVALDVGFEAVAIQHASKFEEIYSAGFDVVVLDLVMPDRDGIEILRCMAELQASEIIILISGYDLGVLHSAQELALEHGLNVIASISKPLVHEKLENLLGSINAVKEKTSGKQFELLELPDKEELQNAIRQGELETWFQPQLDIRSGSLVGVEALVRWKHPQRGFLMPNIIIPSAERSNMMVELTTEVIEQSLKQLASWQKQKIQTNVSINIPANYLHELSIPEQIKKKISAYHLQPEQVILEVTESGLMQDLTKSLDILTRLRMKGIELSIDDFGTGYSSMVQLYRAPFSEIKIDKSFVMQAIVDAEALAIVEITIMLGHKLEMMVVAEGIEDQETWNLLSDLGCDTAQGYFIAKPMPAEQLVRWVKSRIK